MYDQFDGISPEDWRDEDFRRTYKDYHKGDKRLRFPCPDCGKPNAISSWHKQHGYHCAECTRKLEQGY